MRSRSRAGTVRVLAGAGVAFVVLLTGCGSAAPNVFKYVYGTGVGPWHDRPGWQLGYLFGDADNISHATLTVDAVSLTGPGVGTVVSVRAWIAPLGRTRSISSGNYIVSPPASHFGSCQKQDLYRIRGYQLKPGGQFQLWVIITALKPGRWDIPRQVVTYTDGGGTYQHAFPIRYWGTVSPHAAVDPVAGSGEEPCGGARYLNFYRSPRRR